MTVQSAARISSAYHSETKRKGKIAMVLKNYPPNTKEFDGLLIAWTHLVGINSEEEMMLQAMLYEAEIGRPWGV